MAYSLSSALYIIDLYPILNPSMKKIFLITLCLILTVTCCFAQTSKTKKKSSKTKKTTNTTKSTTTTTQPTTQSSTIATDLVPSLSSLTNVDISKGLKEALTIGANNASSLLSKPNGYLANSEVKIPLPQELEKVSNQLRSLGMGQQIDNFEKTMNQAAEKAAVEAAPIFVNAITDMSITDAKNILTGNNNAATTYLQGKCTSQLTTAFTPHVKNALDNSLATSYWKEITTYYNKLPFVTPVNTDLVQYTTGKALEGLFKMVGKEEANIRSNSSTWSTNILKGVFGAK
jgi:Protein of unknown function (DUF4197)